MENSENKEENFNNLKRQGYFGGGRPGPGRPKGSKNRSTIEIRNAYHDLVEGNLDNLAQWLNTIAQDDPYRATDILLKLSEYIMPKMSRQEITGEDGKDILTNIQFTFGPDVNQQDPPTLDASDDTPRIDS